MHFSLLSFAAVLPVLVTALPHPRAPLPPTSISLNKRSGLQNADGSVNFDALLAHMTSTERKIQQGNANLARHTGSNASSPLTKRSNGSEALADSNELLWFGNVSVGTPPKTFTIDFDTGSSDIFLAGPKCGASCLGHTIFNPNSSSTSKDLGQTFNATYGKGNAFGELYTDVVTVAGYTATNQTIIVAEQYGDAFSDQDFPPDGLMGLAFQRLTGYDSPPFFLNLITQKAVPEPVFAVKLADNGSELLLGGINSDLYTGNITYVPVTEEAYWQIDIDGMSANGQQLIKNVSGIADTGTSLLTGDTTNVANFYASLNATSLGNGLYSLPCDNFPNATMEIGGRSFALSSETFNLGPVKYQSPDCVGGLVASDVLNDLWILGDVFLRNTYTIFDVGNTQVGFAELA
ncbi:acid protease [Hygrophoropsis aurantiaca]|uniref:Acid protease n=1 Tax=Hygrophoropsis aurantiaca TaxID=72124 RepID=A0ACB8ANX9_9AGAM|nr:acid protease [Hygrophoropsis aurantiaca]